MKASQMMPLAMREFLAALIDQGIRITYADQAITADNIGDFSDYQLKHSICHDIRLRQKGEA